MAKLPAKTLEVLATKAINNAIEGDWDALSEFELIAYDIRPYITVELDAYLADKVEEYGTEREALRDYNELVETLKEFNLVS